MENVTMSTNFVLTDLIPAETYVIDVFASNIHFQGSPDQITEVTADARMIWQFSFEPYHHIKVAITYVSSLIKCGKLKLFKWASPYMILKNGFYRY